MVYVSVVGEKEELEVEGVSNCGEENFMALSFFTFPLVCVGFC